MQLFGRVLRVLGVLLVGGAMSAHAEEVVQIGGGRGLLNLPAGAPDVGLILMPGGDGEIGIGKGGGIKKDTNWVVHTRDKYLASGMASLLLDAGTDISQAIAFMRQKTKRVVLVAMSRGSTRVPPALADKPDGIVFASSMLSTVRGQLGAPANLPPMLVVHHRGDTCKVTHANDVPAFLKWAGSKAKMVWIDGGSAPAGRDCGGQHYHGFVGRENDVVAAIVAYAGALK